MKKILLFTFAIAISIVFLTNNKKASAQSNGKFLDKNFTTELCKAWNNSTLPNKLGEKGSNWINKGKKKGTQTMVFWVKNCKTKKVQLTVENKDGKAICTYGGIAKTTKPDWKIYPPSYKWFKCATGVNPMWQLLGNFSGSMGVAMKNMGNFKVFFKVVGKLSKSKNADYKSGCKTDKDDLEDINEYLKKI